MPTSANLPNFGTLGGLTESVNVRHFKDKSGTKLIRRMEYTTKEKAEKDYTNTQARGVAASCLLYCT
jgi:hypothetical protein